MRLMTCCRLLLGLEIVVTILLVLRGLCGLRLSVSDVVRVAMWVVAVY